MDGVGAATGVFPTVPPVVGLGGCDRRANAVGLHQGALLLLGHDGRGGLPRHGPDELEVEQELL
jgi:hypothetical protein